MSKSIQPSSLGLRKVDLLLGLPADRLDAIGRECAWRNYEAGQRLIARDAPDRDLHMIVSGTVRVTSYSSAGREISFRDLSGGTSYGEVSALDGLPRSADVVALSSTLIASLPPAPFRALMRDEWVVNERVVLRLCELVRSLTGRVMDLSTLSVQRRIYDQLLRLARAGEVRGNTVRLDPAPKHADMASQVSTYREQITRELSGLVRAGVLARDGGALVVLDLARLEALALESTH